MLLSEIHSKKAVSRLAFFFFVREISQSRSVAIPVSSEIFRWRNFGRVWITILDTYSLSFVDLCECLFSSVCITQLPTSRDRNIILLFLLMLFVDKHCPYNVISVAEMICLALSKAITTYKTYTKWYGRFQNGDFDLSDGERPDIEENLKTKNLSSCFVKISHKYSIS